MQGTSRSGEGGRRACYVTPDLSYDRRERKKKCEDNKWDGKKRKGKKKETIETKGLPARQPGEGGQVSK